MGISCQILQYYNILCLHLCVVTARLLFFPLLLCIDLWNLVSREEALSSSSLASLSHQQHKHHPICVHCEKLCWWNFIRNIFCLFLIHLIFHLTVIKVKVLTRYSLYLFFFIFNTAFLWVGTMYRLILLVSLTLTWEEGGSVEELFPSDWPLWTSVAIGARWLLQGGRHEMP